jgi:hypothetical protein
MTKDYEGKIGIGQMIFCLVALATLFIPFAFATNSSALDNLMPFGDSVITKAQANYLSAFISLLSFSVEIPSEVSYLIYAFYGIVGLTLLLTLLMLFLRNEPVRQLLRGLSIFTGFIMLAIFLVNLFTCAGFFSYFMGDGAEENIQLVECITEKGLIFFLALTFMSALGMIKHFSSFFGKTY